MVSSEPRVLATFQSCVSLAGFSREHKNALGGVPLDIATSFIRHTYRDLKNDPRAPALISEVCSRSAASEFPLAEWLLQIIRVYEWLARQNRRANVTDVLEYITCAFEGSSLQPGHSLDWYLDQYGFERCSTLSPLE